MKFKFCGEQDCPEWILAEMALISKLSSVRVRLLTKQLFIHLIDNVPLVYDKLQKYASSSRVVLDDHELKAIINTIHFIITNATRFNIDPQILYPELEQLGLPSDVSKSLAKIYMAYQSSLAQKLASQTLKLNNLSSIAWRVNYILDSSVGAAPAPEARLVLDIIPSKTIKNGRESGKKETVIFDASLDTLDLLLKELIECQNICNSLDSGDSRGLETATVTSTE